MTTPTTHPRPGCQLTWTRLGNALGYTNTEAKRAEIRTAIEAMTWREPADLTDILDVAPIRQLVASLFYGRAWALHRAAVTALPDDPAGRPRRLIGLHAVTGERYVLLATDYEAIYLVHDTPGSSGVPR